MKFKNIKKKAKNTKSPSNSRTITVSGGMSKYFKFYLPKINQTKLLKLYGGSLKIFTVLIFLLTVVIVGLDFQKNLQTKQNIDSQREMLTKDLNFWEDFISRHQNYRDAYFQASVLEYKLGNTSKAKIYIEKGLVLDPNSESGREIEQILK